MRTLRKLSFLLLLATGGVYAQLDTITLPLKAITIDDGLSQGLVSDIVQDKYGFMWFATKDGLDRYDGYSFTSFTHDPDDSTSLADNTVTALYIDRSDRLWVGTGKGVDLFDPITERFIHAPIQHPDGNWGQVISMVVDRNGDLWASSNRACVKLTFTEAVKDPALIPPFTQHWIEGSYTFEMLSDGRLWGATEQVTLRITPVHGGADVLDTLPRWHHAPPLYDHPAMRFVEDTVRKVILGVGRDHIVAIEGASGRSSVIYVHHHPVDPLANEFMMIDRSGYLWLPTSSGLYRFDPRRHVLSRVMPRDPDHHIASGDLVSVCEDRSGTLWFGTSGYGILRYDPRIERFNKWEDRSIRALSATPSGKVLVSRYWQFFGEFDPVQRKYTTTIKSLKQLPEGEQQHTLHEFSDMVVQDAQGTYWCAMNAGHLIRFRPNGALRLLVPERIPDVLRGLRDGGSLFPLMLGTGHALWFGGDSALWRCDTRTDALTPYHWPIRAVNDPYGFTAALYEGRDGLIWAGTMQGLLCLDPQRGTWKHYRSVPGDKRSLASDIIFSICADPDDPTGVLWLGTSGGGLNRFDTRTGTVERFTTAEGLPNDVVYGVLLDRNGRLWMSTNSGLARFDRQRKAFRNFTVGDGLQSNEFNRYAYCTDVDGRLWFGGVNGFNYFDPEELSEDSTAALIHITGIKLVNKPVNFHEPGSPLVTPAYLAKEMTIPHSVNMVTFEFATLEFASPEIHHYRYKLEGFDPDWISAGTDRSAVYTNLDPGTYTFHVVGDNHDGVWDTKGARFKLVVLPPWWSTWWAYALYVLLVAGGIFTYIRIRTRGLLRQKEVLERTVSERTEQLIRQKDEAEAQRKRAEQSEQVKEQFLANMSHEIRTPMNVIVGMSAVLKRDEHLPAQRQFLDAISSSSENLLVIVNDILDLSKIEAGQLRLEKVAMDPRSIVANLVEVLRFRANEAGLELLLEVAPEVPSKVIGDPTRLHQVLMNLVGNAIKFTASGTVRLVVRSSPTHRSVLGMDTLSLDFTVTDTGIGIAPDRLPHVFEEFMQAETDHTRKYGGTGLGLAISKQLVEMQGGRIHATSTIGKGSVFSFSIPYAKDRGPESIEVPERDTANQRERNSATLGNLRILLAEDNKMNVLVARKQLEDALPGVRIEVAMNGQQAVEMVQAVLYDLVLMDVQMPVMDGYEASRVIRALNSDRARIPILAMTANVMKAQVDKCLDVGMDGFVPKPFKQDQLVDAIRKALRV